MNANTESLHQGANNRLYTKSTDFARKYVKKKTRLVIWSAPRFVSNMMEPMLWHGHVWLPAEPLVFIDDVTGDRSSKMYYEVYRAILFAQFQTKCCSTDWSDG